MLGKKKIPVKAFVGPDSVNCYEMELSEMGKEGFPENVRDESMIRYG